MYINDISSNDGTVFSWYRRGGYWVTTSCSVTIKSEEGLRRLISPPKCDVRLYIYRKADIVPKLIYHVD